MAYDEGLAERVRRFLPQGTRERRMFGGVAFMVSGRLCCSVSGEGLLVRVGNDPAPGDRAHVRPMVMGKRVMKGYLYVEPPALAGDDALAAWVRRALAAVGALDSERE